MIHEFAGGDADVAGTRVLELLVPCLVDGGVDEFSCAEVGSVVEGPIVAQFLVFGLEFADIGGFGVARY